MPLGSPQTLLNDCRNSQISIAVNDALDPTLGPAEGPAIGGNPVVMKGYYVLPTDISRRFDSGILGAESFNNQVYLNVNTRDLDVEFSSNYLAVSFSHQPHACQVVDGKTFCERSEVIDKWAANCKIKVVAASGTNDAGHLCSQWIPPNPVPEIRCIAPAGTSAATSLTIYWHGIATTLDFSYKFAPPRIRKIIPNKVAVSGGLAITLIGENFGEVISWQRLSKSRLAFASSSGRIEIISQAQLPCLSTIYVSDSQLICKVPALGMQKHNVAADRTVTVQVVVNNGNQRSAQTAASALIYTGVPMYYKCGNHASSRSDCFVCCRSACIVDEFALGAKRGGLTYDFCDKECHQYCGFLPTAIQRHGQASRKLWAVPKTLLLTKQMVDMTVPLGIVLVAVTVILAHR